MADFNAKANFNPLISQLDKATKAWQGYNVAQGLAATSAKKFVTQGSKAANTLDKLTSAQSRGTKAADASARAYNKSANSAKKVASGVARATKKTKDLNLSMQSISRIGAFNVISRGVTALTSAMSQALVKAIEFEKKISAIRTISQDSQLSFSKWSDEIRGVSSEFNIDLLDATGAAYQTISNQVAKGAETFSFLRTAANLAITAQGTLGQATDALSSVIKSYNLTVADANDISAKLFKTAELGRVPLDSISDKLGTVTVIASQMGVSMDEVLASLATLTVQGVKPANAMTFLRNALNKTLKPTDAMKKAVGELGFESGEAAIRSLGLVDFLGALSEQSQGTTSEIAQLFGSIRATQFALGATGKNAELYRKNLDALKNATEDFTKATDIARESAGFKFQKALNEISNSLIKVQQVFLSTIVAVTEPLGGVQTAIFGIANAIAVALIPAIRSLNVSLKILTKGNIALFVALSALEIAMSTLPTITKFWGDTLGITSKKVEELATVVDKNDLNKFATNVDKASGRLQSMNAVFVNTSRAISKELGKLIKDSKGFNSKFLKNSAETTKERLSEVKKEIASFGSSLTAIQNRGADLVAGRGDALSQAFTKLKQAREDIEKALKDEDGVALAKAQKREEKALESLGKLAKGSAEGVKNVQEETFRALKKQTADLETLRIKIFKKEKDRQAELLRLSARKIAQEALSSTPLSTVSASKTVQSAINASSTRTKALQTLESTAGSESERKRFNDQIIREQSILAEKIRQIKTNALKKAFNDEAKFLRGQITNLEDQLKKAVEIRGNRRVGIKRNEEIISRANSDISRVTSELGAKPFTPSQLKEQIALSTAPFIAIVNKAQGSIDIIQSRIDKDSLKIRDFQDKIIEVNTSLTKYDETVKNSNAEKEKEANASKTLFKSITSVNDLTKTALKLRGKSQKAILADNKALANKTKATKDDTDSLKKHKDAVDGDKPASRLVSVKAGEINQDAIDTTKSKGNKEDTKSLKIKGKLNEAEQRALKKKQEDDEKNKKLSDARTRATIGIAQGVGSIGSVLEGTANSINLAGIKAEDFGITAEKSQTAFNGATAAVQAFANTLIQGKKKGLNGKQKAGAILSGAASGAATGATIGGAYGAVIGGVIGAGLSAWQVLEKGGKVQYRSKGSTGPEQGTDTVPAMLTPGEFVMNRAATDKFLPQLRAMNDFRNYADGGRVENTTVNVGDINISPGSNGSTQVDVRSLGNEMRREIKNGMLGSLA